MSIDYSKLRPGDRVDCGGRGPFATTTRIVTSGFENAFNRKIAVHTGMIVDVRGQILIAEMAGDGFMSKPKLRIQPLTRYIGNRSRWILAIKRNRAFDDAVMREKIQDHVIADYRRGMEYDYKGLIEFVCERVGDNSERYYCSEYYWARTAGMIAYPREFYKRVSPYDLQVLSNWETVKDWRL
jgi:hypothetical protein